MIIIRWPGREGIGCNDCLFLAIAVEIDPQDLVYLHARVGHSCFLQDFGCSILIGLVGWIADLDLPRRGVPRARNGEHRITASVVAGEIQERCLRARLSSRYATRLA
jgi:hypothetical protein